MTRELPASASANDIQCPECDEIALNPGPTGYRPQECKWCGFVLPVDGRTGPWDEVQFPQLFPSVDDEEDYEEDEPEQQNDRT